MLMPRQSFISVCQSSSLLPIWSRLPFAYVVCNTVFNVDGQGPPRALSIDCHSRPASMPLIMEELPCDHIYVQVAREVWVERRGMAEPLCSLSAVHPQLLPSPPTRLLSDLLRHHHTSDRTPLLEALLAPSHLVSCTVLLVSSCDVRGVVQT